MSKLADDLALFRKCSDDLAEEIEYGDHDNSHSERTRFLELINIISLIQERLIELAK